jgi:hypothetical protein
MLVPEKEVEGEDKAEVDGALTGGRRAIGREMCGLWKA